MKHISRDGVIRDCNAEAGRCPLRHYSTEAEAEEYIESQHLNEGLKKAPQHVMKVEPQVDRAITTLSKVGRPYIVGGAVRDSFFNAENKDIDVEVHESDLDAITRQLRKDGYSVDEVGKSFGVLKVTGNGVRDLDVSVPRRENRVGSGHRDFSVDLSPLTVEEAAERRDFTFNAIMYDPVSKRVVDPANGERDLKSGTLRHVSPKFAEDPLRVMRGFQMASRFNMTYAPETAQECKRIRGEYSSLSNERIREEWAKFYTKGINAKAGVRALQDSGWDDTEPGLRDALRNQETVDGLTRLKNAPRENREVLGLAITTRSMSSNDAGNFRSRVATNKKQSEQAELLVKAENTDLSSSYDRRWFAHRNPGFSFETYSHYGHALNRPDLVDVSESARLDGLTNGPEKDLVRGDEVADRVGRKPGPWMKNALDSLRDLQYSRKVTTRESLLDAAERLFK